MTPCKSLAALFLMGLMGQSLGFAELSALFRKLHITNSHQAMDTSTSISTFSTMPDKLDVDSAPDHHELTPSQHVDNFLYSFLSKFARRGSNQHAPRCT